MKILSLFDGISCGRLALERAGLTVSRYVAYEIDPHAIAVSNWNWPDIEQKGSVEGADFTQYRGFDMVIGGFPCTDLSSAKVGREGLAGKHSRLFWEQVRAIKEVKPRYFFVENNYGMPKKDERIITETLGVLPICINSALVSAQNRRRLYWTNIPDVEQPEDKGVELHDILETDAFVKKSKRIHAASVVGRRLVDGVRKDYARDVKPIQCLEVRPKVKSSCLTTIAKDNCISDLPPGRYVDAYNAYKDHFRELTPLECERLQGLPDGYTEMISNSQRINVLGMAWNVDTIAHIFNHIHLDDLL